MGRRLLYATIAITCATATLGAFAQPDSTSASTGALAASRPTVTLQGRGARVLSVALRYRGPVVMAASHSGSSNFAIQLVPRRGYADLLVNEIGPYRGQVATKDSVAPGRYRLTIEADGAWKVSLQQPAASSRDLRLPRTFEGRGSRVFAVQTRLDQLVVRAVHSGRSNFAVFLIPLSGGFSDLLFNEIGRYRGETLAQIEPGHYLLAVEADGSWSVSFRR